jgi:hypothetical protein
MGYKTKPLFCSIKENTPCMCFGENNNNNNKKIIIILRKRRKERGVPCRREREKRLDSKLQV